MRQVPEQPCNYLLVGNGRLARHLMHYMKWLNLPYKQYTRHASESFDSFLTGISHILVLISDKAIVDFISEHKISTPPSVTWVHCSGLISTELAESAHPLTSFADELFDLEFYRSIPFILEKDRKPFSEVLPGFPNPYHYIDKERKELYHAMCVVSGNFSTLLWTSFKKYITDTLDAHPSMMLPYLQSITKNLEHSTDPLTGPLKRNDTKTIERHLQQLQDTPLHELYTAFVDYYAKTNRP